jgi:hypothetical protein
MTPSPSLQVPAKTRPATGVPGHTNPFHLQETAAAAYAETDHIDFQDMTAVQATCPEIQRLIAGGSSLTDCQDMAAEQATCPEMQRLIAGAAHSKLIFRSFRVTDWQGTAPQACGDCWCCYRQIEPLDGGTSPG